MKKRTTKILLVAALVFCMSFAMTGLDAHAATVGNLIVGVDAGTITIYQSEDIVNCTLSGNGSVPPGMSLHYRPNTNVTLRGIPTATGTYSFSCVVAKTDGSNERFDTVVNVVAAADRNVYEDSSVMQDGGYGGSPTTSAGSAPKITKHPTGETVEAGATAKFIARADNATKFTWRIVSKDTTCTYKASEAEYYFPGLKVSGTNTDTLVLSNIPASMSTWSVECMFQNDYGNSFSNGAIITVKSAAATPKPAATTAATPAPAANNSGTTQAPAPETTPDPNTKTANITTQPQSAQVKKGETVKLSVYATSPDNGDVSYQWYSSPVNDRAAALPISGANSESYDVTPTESAVFYWAAAWNTKDGKRSEPVYTEAAQVMLIPEATPTPVPTVAPTPTPADDGGDFLGGNFQLILFAAIGLLALAALIGVVIYLRIESKREDE